MVAAKTGTMAPTPAAAESLTRARNQESSIGCRMPTAMVKETGHAREKSERSLSETVLVRSCAIGGESLASPEARCRNPLLRYSPGSPAPARSLFADKL